MKVELNPAFEKIVREKVESGLYRDAEEVISDALRLLDRIDRVDEAKLDALRAAVQLGIDDVEAGRFTEISTDEELEALFQAP
jgi:antitoxin ParD1/3/4